MLAGTAARTLSYSTPVPSKEKWAEWLTTLCMQQLLVYGRLEGPPSKGAGSYNAKAKIGLMRGFGIIPAILQVEFFVIKFCSRSMIRNRTYVRSSGDGKDLRIATWPFEPPRWAAIFQVSLKAYTSAIKRYSGFLGVPSSETSRSQMSFSQIQNWIGLASGEAKKVTTPINEWKFPG